MHDKLYSLNRLLWAKQEIAASFTRAAQQKPQAVLLGVLPFYRCAVFSFAISSSRI
jgi:hypothetical protein